MSTLPFSRLVILGMAMLALAACNDSRGATPSAGQPQGRAVLTQTVRYETRGKLRDFVGVIRPRLESNLGFRVAGKIAERRVILGQRVKAGEILATLDPVDLNLQREQAIAELNAATVSLDQNERQSARNFELRQKGWITDATVQLQQAATAEARGRLERAKRSRELAANQLSYADLIADEEGIVTAILAEPGQVVAVGTPVLRLAKAHELEVAIDVPETLAADVRKGEATVKLWSNPERIYHAHLREFAAAADPAARTFAARFPVDDADEALSIGMTATLVLNQKGAVPLAVLPISAMLDDGNGPTVFVVNLGSQTLRRKNVEVEGYAGANVLIRAGIADGDVVVSQGVHKLLDGEKVRLVAERG